MTMSSPNQTVSENTDLLRYSRPVDSLGKSLWRRGLTFPPETLLIPIAVATRLASVIPTTTIVDLIRQVICRLWNASHRDPSPPLGGPGSPALCDAPEIARLFSTAIAIVAAAEGIIAVVQCGLLSRFSSRYGRKSAFLLIFISGIVGGSMIPGSQSKYMPDWLADWVFLLGLLLLFFSSSIICSYLVNIYIVDVCVPENRTAALSKISGWTSLGSCISYALGGFVTTKTGNFLIVFYTATALYAATGIYAVFVLPESFPQEKRSALSRLRSEPSTAVTTRFTFLRTFEPLKILLPARRLDGTRNWRLTWCAVHIFIFMAANAYTTTAWLVLATSKYNLTPADTGLILTIITVSATISLTVIVPPLLRLLRPYYHRKMRCILLAEESMIDGEEPESEASDLLDVHLTFVACALTAVFALTAAASTTNRALILSGICIGAGYAHTPTIRSLVAGSVDPLKQGEALAAFEMVANTGTFFSTIVMGSILTATIETAPLTTFYIHLVVVIVSGMLLFLIRDEDKYRKPHEE